MITALDRPLRRSIEIGGVAYVVTMHTGGIRLVRKGRRKGIEVTWEQFLAGEVVLAEQLTGSLASPTPATAVRR